MSATRPTSAASLRLLAALAVMALIATACGGDDEVSTTPPDVATQAEADDPVDVATEAEDPVDDDAAAADVEDCESGIAIRASHHLGEENAGHEALVAMAEEIEQTTDGRVTMEAFSGAQLGGIAENIENLRSGVIEMAWIDSSSLAAVAPEIGALSLPFIFQSDAEMHAIVDGDIGQDINDLAAEQGGVEVLFWSSVGFMYPHFSGDVQVRSPEDFEGLQIRVSQSPVFINTFRALGAQPVDLPLGDTYTSLQTGAVDGYVLPYWATRDTSLYEVSDTLSDIGVVQANIAVAVSPTFMDGLCEADAAAIRAAAAVGEEINRTGWPQEDAEALEILVDSGIEIVPVDDFDAFRSAAIPVWEEFEADHGGDIWDRIKEEQGIDL